ncbi:hypothetical protein BKA65DRAFT_485600 [Rhexocercosporidium sp. MPI-PUGE-AT-0058]|nr:hypothetical protein BKA65DRAFT_485600 [Rhexocercosporidium sp. MPI-PUGE-AT-0058]
MVRSIDVGEEGEEEEREEEKGEEQESPWEGSRVVGKAAVAKHQARWWLDGQTVEYRAVDLQMSQISDLVVSEYQQAYALLYDELLFEAKDLIPMESWRLKNDLDLEDFGGSWLCHPSNAEFVEGAELALFWRIQGGNASTPRDP